MSHHAILYMAAKRAKCPPFSHYMMLGDDIVIWHDRLAVEYQALLAKLDVQTSEHKSHISKDMFEFAKRWKYGKEEVSPFPVHALLEIGPKYWLLWELFSQCEKKGFPSLLDSLSKGSWDDLYYRLGKRGRLKDQLIRSTLSMIHTPVSEDSPETRGLKIKKLLDIHRISYSCSMTPITLNNEFSFMAMLSMSKTFRKDEESLVNKVKTVKRALFELVDDLSNNIPADDRPQVRVDITNHLPFIMAADMEISKVVKDWETFNEEGSLSFDP